MGARGHACCDFIRAHNPVLAALGTSTTGQSLRLDHLPRDAFLPMSQPEKYLTVADMARLLNEPRHRIVWIIKARDIRHAVQLGGQHGYTSDAVKTAARELQLIDSRR